MVKKTEVVALSDADLLSTMIDRHIRELEAAKNESIVFRLWGAVVPKARPRSSYNHSSDSTIHYMPEKYTDWKTGAIKALEEIKKLYPQHTFPLLKCSAFYILDGKHNRNGDGDNIAGSINDALVNAKDNTTKKKESRRKALDDALEHSGILKEDNLMKIPCQSIILNYSDKRPPSTLICLY